MKPKQLTMNIEAETDVCVNGGDLMTTDVQIKVTGYRDKNCKITLKAVSVTEPIKVELPELGLLGSDAFTSHAAGRRPLVWEGLSEAFKETLIEVLYEQYEMEDEENA